MNEALTRIAVQLRSQLTELSHRLAADEEGQTAAEYVGIVVVVGIIIGAIATSGVHEQLSDGVSNVITEILGNGESS